jgi:hypothetical protein
MPGVESFKNTFSGAGIAKTGLAKEGLLPLINKEGEVQMQLLKLLIS